MDTMQEPDTGKLKISLRREYLRGDYDSRGRYFGQGAPLYVWSDDSGEFSGHVRGASRDVAKARVRDEVRGREVAFYR
jgi:hypothetical protein